MGSRNGSLSAYGLVKFKLDHKLRCSMVNSPGNHCPDIGCCIRGGYDLSSLNRMKNQCELKEECDELFGHQ